MAVDPTSGWHNPHVGESGRRLVLVCSHGYSSSLAAATLVDLGLAGTGDVAGGFEAWCRAGLPVVPAPPRRDDVLPGMGGPEPLSRRVPAEEPPLPAGQPPGYAID